MDWSFVLSPQMIALVMAVLAMTIVLRRLFRGTRRRTTTAYVGPDARARQRQSAQQETPNAVVAEDWARGRRVCPCCGYAATSDATSACLICDWEEPLAERPEWGVDATDRAEELAAAQERFRTTGSSLTSEERAELPEPTSGQQMLRRRLRERLEYLRSGDPPDASETWDEVDYLVAQLRTEADRRLDR